MKYYKELAKLGTFTLEDVNTITKNTSKSSKALNTLIKLGIIKRLRRNLYTCVDLITGDAASNKYIIASNINDNSYVSYHSAFEFYGFYNQVYNEVQVSSFKRFINFEIEDNNYRCFLTKSNISIETIGGVKVSSIERTIVDSINMLGKVMDVEELVKCLQLIHFVDEKKIIEVLKEYNKEILYRKVGYFLSFFKESFELDDAFFEYCKSNSDFTYRGKISSNEINELTYIKEWSLYGYKNILSIANKSHIENV